MIRATPSASPPGKSSATTCSLRENRNRLHPQPPRPAASPHQIPPAAAEFFGRSSELATLIKRLKAAQNTAVVGPAGLGKTALAAKALRAVVGDNADSLPASPYPDGVVYLDLYSFHGEAQPTWDALANTLAGPEFLERTPSQDRAKEACRNRRILVVVEGAEEASGEDGRPSITDILGVLSPENCRLLLTRLKTQAAVADTVELKQSLSAPDDGDLLDSLTNGRLAPAVRASALQLLEGHPLALTWAANLLSRDDEDPALLVNQWAAADLPDLSDPQESRRTLRWLFERSTRLLDPDAELILSAAALLAHTPFALDSMTAALGEGTADGQGRARQALRTLVQHNLLRRTDEPDHWQFTHVLGYQFARRESGSDPELRQRLGLWLYEQLVDATKPGADGVASAELPRLLEHLTALLRTDADQQLWLPLANAALYNFTDRLTELGRLSLVNILLSAAEGWFDRQPEDVSQSAQWLRERAALHSRQGNVLAVQGDLAGALDFYRLALDVSRSLAQADPSNAVWQRDLSYSYTQMAQLRRRQGEIEAALEFAKKSLSIDERLVQLDPTNATWRSDVEVSRAIVEGLRS